MKQEKRKLSGRKKIVFFIVLLLVSFSVVVSFGHEKKEIEEIDDYIIWKVSYVASELKLKDYIYSTSEEGCRCYYRPYEFNSTYFQFPSILTDSSVVMEEFHEFYNESYIAFEVYPLCFVGDWNKDLKKEDGTLLTVRNESVDTWVVCQKLGLIDSTGHYID